MRVVQLNSSKLSSRLTTGIFIIFLSTSLLVYNFLFETNNNYQTENLVLIAGYFFTACLYLITILKEPDIDFFHPIHLTTFIYICIFFITPLLLISIGEEDCFGVNVMGGCITATLIFVASYFFYVLGYNRIQYKKIVFVEYSTIREKTRKKTVKVSLIIWTIAFALSLYYLFITGRSLAFILSLGSQGVKVDSQTNMLFLSNFTLCMIIPLVYIMKYSKSKFIFIVLTFLTFATMYIRGFRIFVLIMILGLFIVYLKSNRKKASIRTIAVFVTISILFFTFLGQSRTNLRSGNFEDNSSAFNTEAFAHMFESNFNIYKPFYGLVTKYPEKYDHTLGKSMIWDSIINWIPRSLWSGKPLAADQTMPVGLKNSVSEYAIDKAAMAWPNIAEMYMEFGVVGCLVLFYIFGYYSKKALSLYYKNNINHLIAYSVLIPLIFQFIIRGALSQFIPFLIFVLLPFLVIKKNQST